MNDDLLTGAVKALGAAVNEEVDELGLVFTSDGHLVREGAKLGIPHKLVPALYGCASKLPTSDAQLFALLVCNG
jgi:hypothetical protein